MVQKHFILLLLGVLISAKPAQIFGQQNGLRKQIEKIIKYDSEINFEHTPSFLVAVLDRGQQAIETFGGDKPDLNAVNESAVFELGSISKAITTEILFELVKNKELSLLDKVNDLLPEGYENPRLKDLILQDFLDFKSKLPAVFKGSGLYEHDPTNPYENYTKENLLQFYKNYIPEEEIIQHNYKDTDFAILEIILENVSGFSFDQLLQLHVNDALGTNFFATKYERKDSLVVEGLNRSGIKGEPMFFSSFSASEGIKGTVIDLIKLVNFWNEKYLNSVETKKDFKGLKETWTSSIRGYNGLYLVDVGRGNFPFVANGLTNIHHTFIGFLPKTKTGVIVLANSATGTKDLGMLVLRMLNNNWKRKN